MSRRTLWFVAGGLLVAFVLAFGVSRYASSKPDGLDKVAIDKGFSSAETPHDFDDSPFAGYSTRGVSDSGLATGTAGVIGVVAVFVVAAGSVWLATRVRHGGTARGDRQPPLVGDSPPPT
jgi:hypothetical protein